MENDNSKAKLMAGLSIGLFVLLFPLIFIGQFMFTFCIASDKTELAIVGAILMIIGYALDIAVCVLMVIANWKLFVKMGEEGWKSIIPFYNLYIMLEKAGYPGLLVLLVLVPGFGSLALCVIMIMAWISLGEKFGKTTGWTVAFLVFFNMIGIPYLAWSDDTFNPALGHQANS